MFSNDKNMPSISILAKIDPSSGDYTVYDGGFLRSINGQTETESRTDDQKRRIPLPRVGDRGHYLTLIVGKGLNSKDTSKLYIMYCPCY